MKTRRPFRHVALFERPCPLQGSAKDLFVQKPTKAINQFLEGLASAAVKEEEKGNYGLAYQFMKMVTDVDANFSGAKTRFNLLQEKISQRAIKGLAVIPFKSPPSPRRPERYSPQTSPSSCTRTFHPTLRSWRGRP